MKQIILITIFSLIGQVIFSQNQTTITGKVTNDKNEPLQKATVKAKNGKETTLTDAEGKFSIRVVTIPVTLIISSAEYDEKILTVTGTEELNIIMTEVEKTLEAVIVNPSDNRIRSKSGENTITVENIPQRELKISPLSPYDNLQIKKGVYGTTSSLLFNTYVPRGFNGSGSTRINQRIDGMDNQAPGLNFFVGNFVNGGDLDIENMQLLSGASSALYGPGGMNGTILINSKNPFNPRYQGLSVLIKPGIMHVGAKSPRENSSMYHDYSFRYAKNFNDKFALKLGAQYVSADDWLANDSTNYRREGTSGKLIGGTRITDPNYDGVNVYGDETKVANQDIRDIFTGGAYLLMAQDPTKIPALSALMASDLPGLSAVSRTGYQEKDIIDPKTKNIKLNGALHYMLTDKIEAQLMGYWSTGNTVYTDDNRYVLKGIKLGQYKFELKHKNWFLRAYTTQEDAGEAYSATIAAQYFNEAWKQSFNPTVVAANPVRFFDYWYGQYAAAYWNARLAGADVMTSHNTGRGYADIGRPEAGSPQFKQIFDQVRKMPIPNGGLFKEKSQLWMGEGQYSFGDAAKNAEVIIGGNYKRYILDSDGTLFIDTVNAIGINEAGGYAQVTRKLFDNKLTLSASGRFDKNENFKAQFTPRFAALLTFAKANNLRMSYQTAYRFPGNLAQWIRLDVGGDYLLLGGLPWVKQYMDVEKNPVHLIRPDGTIESTPYVFNDFKPETMRSFEIGYNGIIEDKVLIDAYAYVGKYEDFIGRIGLYQPNTDEAFSITVNSTNQVKTYGYGVGIDYLLGKKKNTSVFLNLYSDMIKDVPLGFKAYFNTPKYKMSAGVANSGFGKDDRVSFSAMLRWQDAFQWEGELANGPLNAFTAIDAQISYKFPKIKSRVRLGGTNILNHYYKNGFGNPSVGGIYYISFGYNL